MSEVLKATLYLGANIAGVPGVSHSEFASFLQDHVTPSFPGFTVRETLGYWEGKPELSRELVILTEPNLTEKIEAIARDYKDIFRQDAVMISYEPVRVLWDVPTVQQGRMDYEAQSYHSAGAA